MIPPRRDCFLQDRHRLIPSKYSHDGTVLARLTDRESEIQDLIELDGATNARLLGEEGLLPDIGVHELLYGIPWSEIVNAAFTHAAPHGGRFDNSRRGAWYASFERETSLSEVAFHRLEQLREVNWEPEEVCTWDDYLADFAAEFHDLRGSGTRFRRYLQPGPLPECYTASQRLAADLLRRGSNGIVYPSVRRSGGTCIVCLRPALVYHVRRAARLEIRLRSSVPFSPDQVRELPLPS